MKRFSYPLRSFSWQVPAALAALWLAFGGVFVAGKIGVTAAPPFLFNGPRFMIAGVILLGWTVWREKGLRLSWRELLEAAGVGLLIIAAGQGSAMWGLTSMPAGLVAVLSATMPLWLTLLSLLFLHRGIPKLGAVGLVVSFIGACLLASPSGSGAKALPLVLLMLGMVAWAGGALLASQSKVGRRPLLLSSLQMLFGGAAQLGLAFGLGEPVHFHWSTVLTGPVVGAFAFSLFGSSLIGFTAYAWLLRNAPPTIANSFAYAAPVVAIFLSWLILKDPVGPRTMVLAVVVLAGLAVLIWSQGHTHRLEVPADVAETEKLSDAA
ncbi:MAG: DMT family transporter [Candidatus Dormibacteraceae bacterium]